jgi:hypothetical protein
MFSGVSRFGRRDRIKRATNTACLLHDEPPARLIGFLELANHIQLRRPRAHHNPHNQRTSRTRLSLCNWHRTLFARLSTSAPSSECDTGGFFRHVRCYTLRVISCSRPSEPSTWCTAGSSCDQHSCSRVLPHVATILYIAAQKGERSCGAAQSAQSLPRMRSFALRDPRMLPCSLIS